MTGYAQDEDGNVVLTMTRADYEEVLMALGYFIGGVTKDEPETFDNLFRWVNRINAGNPNYRPYEVKP